MLRAAGTMRSRDDPGFDTFYKAYGAASKYAQGHRSETKKHAALAELIAALGEANAHHAERAYAELVGASLNLDELERAHDELVRFDAYVVSLAERADHWFPGGDTGDVVRFARARNALMWANYSMAIGARDEAEQALTRVELEIAGITKENLERRIKTVFAWLRSRRELLLQQGRWQACLDQCDQDLAYLDSLDAKGAEGKFTLRVQRLVALDGRWRQSWDPAVLAAYRDTVAALVSSGEFAASPPQERQAVLRRTAWIEQSAGDEARFGAAVDALGQALGASPKGSTALELAALAALVPGDVALSDAYARWRSAFDAVLASLATVPLRLGGWSPISTVSDTRPLNVGLNLAATAHGVSEALDVALALEGLSSLVRTRGVAPVDAAAVQAWLGGLAGAPTGALVYVPTASATQLFVVEAGHVEQHHLAPQRDLTRVVRDLHAVVSLPPDAHGPDRLARVEAVAVDATRALLPPSVQQRLATWGTVYVVGTEALGPLPFAALRLDGEWLGLELAIVQPVALALQVQGTREAERALAVADATASVVGAEPLTAAWVKALGAGFDGVAHTPYARDDTRDLTEPCSAAEGGVLVVIGHGEFDPTAPAPFGLRLSERRSVFAPELRGPGSPAVVFLGVCSSGAEPTRARDATSASLGGAFLLGGAACVVHAIGDVAYTPTKTLAQRFVAEFAVEDRTAAAAMLGARRALAAEGGGDPFRFALFELIGDGRVTAAPR